jgi:predicted metal-dependent peptidase
LSKETKDNIIKDAIRQAVEACASRGIGNLPGDIQAEIQKCLERKKACLPWYQILRRFAAHATRSTITYTKKRMSKRYQTRPGIKIGKRLNMLVGIDTSGSISDKHLEMFASEIWFIKRCGADVTVAECDTQINRVYPFKREILSVVGRGGTDMNKVLEYYENHKEFDLTILLTDGYTPMREYGPRRPWLWCFTNQHDKPVEWGQSVVLPPEEVA